MSTSVLVTVPWWRALLEKVGRNAVQVSLPFLIAVVRAGGDVDLATVGCGLAGAVGASVVKWILMELASLQVTPGTAFGWQLLDRAVPAAAGVLLGVWPADLAGIAALDVRAALIAAGAAALIAVGGNWATPPVFTPTPMPQRDSGLAA